MIAKKNARADLEKKRGVLFQIGLLTAGSFTLAAFTYTTPTQRAANERYVDEQEIVYELMDEEQPEEKVFEQPKTDNDQSQQDQNQNDQNNATSEVSEDSEEVDNSDQTNETTVTVTGGGGELITGGTVDIDEGELIDIPAIDASYPGGYAAMMEFIQKNYKFPEDAMEMGEQGKVYVDFIVEKDGSISNITIYKKVFPSIDREAKRVVGLFPKWNPGEMEYGKVRTKVSLPILVTLKNN